MNARYIEDCSWFMSSSYDAFDAVVMVLHVKSTWWTEGHVLTHCPDLDLMRPSKLDLGTALCEKPFIYLEGVSRWIHRCWRS